MDGLNKGSYEPAATDSPLPPTTPSSSHNVNLNSHVRSKKGIFIRTITPSGPLSSPSPSSAGSPSGVRNRAYSLSDDEGEHDHLFTDLNGEDDQDAEESDIDHKETYYELTRRIERKETNQVKVLVYPFDRNEQQYRDLTLKELLLYIKAPRGHMHMVIESLCCRGFPSSLYY